MSQLVLPVWLDSHRRHRGDAIALSDAQRSYSYEELLGEVGAVAGGLARLGVEPGDRVVTAMEPSAAHVAVVLGALYRGAIAVPLNIRLNPPEASAYLAALAPRLVVSDSVHLGLASGLGIDVVATLPLRGRAFACREFGGRGTGCSGLRSRSRPG